jgi:hypothetical protein
MSEQIRREQVASIEGLIERKRLEVLPENRRRVIEQIKESLERLKKGEAEEEDREFIRRVFNALGGVAQEIQENLIKELAEHKHLRTPELRKKLKTALDDLYLLLLTSLSPKDLNENIRREIMRINTADFEKIMARWEASPGGIDFVYKLKPPEGEGPEIIETAAEQEGKHVEGRVETEEGFGYVFKPDPDFWRSIFLLGREEKEAEFNRVLTEAVLRFRQLTERLSKIKLPKEIKEVILEEDEDKRNEKINQLSEEDQALVRIILNIQRNLLETFQKISDIKSHEKEFSAEDLEKLNQELSKLKKEADDYEEAIKKLEERFGTTYQPDKELAKGFLGRIGQWIKEKFPMIGSALGLWGLAIGWFLPLWLMSKMYDQIEQGGLIGKKK